jgi:hypothetical protein
MRIAHVALWTHDLDGRRNSNAERFRCFDRRGYPAKALGFRQPCSDQAFPVALVPPLSRPFLPFGERSLSAQLRRPRPQSATSAIRRNRPAASRNSGHSPLER